jgi:hypothetical protein|tara:strand:+ start:234 stop:434 length:201 start_codon:yes stop_codon:yes gene_type:complete
MDVQQQQLYLTKSLRELLKSAAKSQRRSVSSLAEELLTDGLSRREGDFNSQKAQLEHLENIAKSIR